MSFTPCNNTDCKRKGICKRFDPKNPDAQNFYEIQEKLASTEWKYNADSVIVECGYFLTKRKVKK